MCFQSKLTDYYPIITLYCCYLIHLKPECVLTGLFQSKMSFCYCILLSGLTVYFTAQELNNLPCTFRIYPTGNIHHFSQFISHLGYSWNLKIQRNFNFTSLWSIKPVCILIQFSLKMHMTSKQCGRGGGGGTASWLHVLRAFFLLIRQREMTM